MESKEKFNPENTKNSEGQKIDQTVERILREQFPGLNDEKKSYIAEQIEVCRAMSDGDEDRFKEEIGKIRLPGKSSGRVEIGKALVLSAALLFAGTVIEQGVGKYKGPPDQQPTEQELPAGYEEALKQRDAEYTLDYIPNQVKSGNTETDDDPTLKRPYSWVREKFSYDVNRIFERYTEGDPNVEMVSMNGGRSIQVGPDDEEKIIFTRSLAGCYGTLVFTEHKDGRRNAVLTHYSPTEVSRNMARLRELISQSSAMKEAKTKQTVVVMGTGEWVQDPETQKWMLKPSPESKREVDGIIMAIRSELGGDVEVKFEPYSDSRMMGRLDQGTMVVTIPPKGEGGAGFKTWFGAGKLGAEEK